MRLYFSGIGGVGIGPLAEIAADAGHAVMGSDREKSIMSKHIEEKNIEVFYSQDGKQLKQMHDEMPINWFIHTSALPLDHPELATAKELGIRTSKRDEFLAEFITSHKLKLVAVAGTHGKTTTTGMVIWTMKQLGIPVSYSVGTTISYGASGQYDDASEYFIYECDEFDKNFLHFEPHTSIITSLNHDHVETYPTINHYRNAFVQFLEKSNTSIMWQKDYQYLATDPKADCIIYDEHNDMSSISLPGLHMRQNAYLVVKTLQRLFPHVEEKEILDAVNSFPGTTRRFEKLDDNLYTDYAHHPDEIKATLQMAKELSASVVAVYQPHQNMRQHELKASYTDCFESADEIYWLPTYLTREDPALETLTPKDLTGKLTNEAVLHYADLDDALWQNINRHRSAGRLVICMGAGSIDEWIRNQLT